MCVPTWNPTTLELKVIININHTFGAKADLEWGKLCWDALGCESPFCISTRSPVSFLCWPDISGMRFWWAWFLCCPWKANKRTFHSSVLSWRSSAFWNWSASAHPGSYFSTSASRTQWAAHHFPCRSFWSCVCGSSWWSWGNSFVYPLCCWTVRRPCCCWQFGGSNASFEGS